MSFSEAQNKISRLYANPEATLADYLSFTESLNSFAVNKAKKDKEIPAYMRQGKIAVLSSFTVQGLLELMKVRGVFHNLWLETFTSGYNQFNQEILNQNSGLYAFQPNIVYLIIEAKDFLNKEHLHEILAALSTNSKAKIVLFNFISSEDKFADDFNKNLKEIEEKYASVSVFDFASFLDHIGKEKYWYTKYKKLGDLRLAPDAFIPLSEKLLGYAIDFLGATKKCLVTDLDNTLWKGIVGEDGSRQVLPNKDLQEYLLKLSKGGTILAINSKNNLADAFETIDNHPEMVLRKKDFAAWRINWQDKARNIQELAKEINIGTDSLVFIDDSSFEMDLVRSYLPEVAVVPIEYIKEYSGFQKSSMTKEDARRGEMYQEEKEREALKSSFGNVDEYLKNLEIKIKVSEASTENIPRISQLTQKTNQFNVTTRRYTEDNIRDFLKKGWHVWALEVYDRFGEYGLTGVCIVGVLMPEKVHKTSKTAKKAVKTARIDTLLLSCRVLGREVERAFLGFIMEKLKDEKVGKLVGEHIPTKKNVLCETFFQDNNFAMTKKEGESTFFECDLKKKFKMPTFVKII